MSVLAKLAESREEGFLASFSYELFMPDATSDALLDVLAAKVDRFAATEPLFVDIAAYGNADAVRDSLKLAVRARRYAGLATMVHIPASLPRCEAAALLDEALASGVRSLFIERGEAQGAGSPATPPFHSPLEATAASLSPFPSVPDLLAFIRARHGDAFCLVVGGGPGEPGGYAALRSAQEAGANLILARPVFAATDFLSYAAAAAHAGVRIPIAPSILLLYNPVTTTATTAACGVTLPPALATALAAAGSDEGAYRAVGAAATTAVCRDLLAAGIPMLHLLTLNLESVARLVLNDLGLCGPGAAARRKLPWRPSGDESRAGEDVRPIFWANRPASYVERTSAWTSFPCGRWAAGGGSAASVGRPFTEIADSQLVPASAGTPEERRAMWCDAPVSQSDVWAVFASYVSGAIPRLPWCEVALLPETGTIQAQLADINRGGFLTINSQPRVNAARSDDPTFGWGGPGGYVYQKAYVECFCSPAHLAALMHACAAGNRPSVTYHAVDVEGRCMTNSREGAAAAAASSGSGSPILTPLPSGGDAAAWSSVVAVTWGVFPDKEILQPTVMDPETFRGAWRAEAFALWRQQWAVIYEEGSVASDVVHTIHDTYFLVNLVDNDFIESDLFRVVQNAVAILQQPGAAERDPIAVYAQLALTQGKGGGLSLR
jgi:methylenetetrahydrofolate reductase (NADPH)